MRNQTFAILLVIFSTLFTTSGQILFKIGADNLVYEVMALVTNWGIILGFVAYGMGAGLLIFALKKGDLSVVYPFVSLSFIWVSLIAFLFLNESLILVNWVGIFLIVSGISFIGFGANHA